MLPINVFISNIYRSSFFFNFLMVFIFPVSVFIVDDLPGFQRNFDRNQKGKDMAGSKNVHEGLI